MSEKTTVTCGWCGQAIAAHKTPAGTWRLAPHTARLDGRLLYCMGSRTELSAADAPDQDSKIEAAAPCES